ncbi:hypothetical protein ACW7G2_12410 [Luteimonas sp. A277]
MIRTSLIAAALFALAAHAPAHAEEVAPTLQVNSGTVMTSQGGEFVTAASGASVAPGTRIMLAENSSASVVYASGCTAAISAAGVHAVPAMCQAGSAQAAVGATAATGTQWASAGWLFLGTAAVAVALSEISGDGDPLPSPVTPPPVSR